MPISPDQAERLAKKFEDLGGNPVKVETLLDDADIEVWNTKREKISLALSRFMLTIQNGEVRRIERREFKNTVKTSFEEFMIGAKAVARTITEPVTLDIVLSMIGINSSAIPRIGLNSYMKKCGLHFIEGVGYWTEEQYANDDGQIWTTKRRGEKALIVLEALRQYGWPICGAEVERASMGEVTSQYIAVIATSQKSRMIKSIGNAGLYVPVGAISRHPFPISERVAQTILKALKCQTKITNGEFPLMYKLGFALAKIDYVTLKQTTVFRNGRRQRCIQLELTQHGFQMLAGSKKPDKDEF